MWGLFEEVDAGYEYISCLLSIHATKEGAITESNSHDSPEDCYVVELKVGQPIWDIEKECGFK